MLGASPSSYISADSRDYQAPAFVDAPLLLRGPHKCGVSRYPGYRPLSQRQTTEPRSTPSMSTFLSSDTRSRSAVRLARRSRNIPPSFQTNRAFTPLGPFTDICIYCDASPTVSSHPFGSTLNLIIWINSIIRSPPSNCPADVRVAPLLSDVRLELRPAPGDSQGRREVA